jgi:hypothetical protein
MVTTGARLMPKFTLTAEHTDLHGTPDGTKVNYEFHGTFLTEILEHLELFLRGTGFCPTGTLDFIPDEEYYGTTEWEPEEEWSTEQWATPQDHQELYDEQDLPKTKSHYYFDTERNK